MKRALFALLLLINSAHGETQFFHTTLEGVNSRMGIAASKIEYERPDGKSIVTGHGSAVFLDLSTYGYAGKRFLITAAHNVMNREGKLYGVIRVQLSDGTWSKATILQVDQNLDICLVASEQENDVVSLLSDKDAKKEEIVLLIASWRGGPIKETVGTVEKRYHDGTVKTKVVLDFDHGCSGGALFSRDGRVVGMAVSGVPQDGDLAHDCGLFLPTSCIESFLDEHRKKE